MASTSGKAFNVTILKRLFSYAKPHRALLWGTIATIIIVTVLTGIRPYLLSQALDEDSLKNFNNQFIIKLTVLVSVLVIAESFFTYLQSLFAGALGLNITAAIRKQIHSHIIKLRLRYYDTHPIGMLVTRVVSDIETINEVFSEGLIILFGDFLKLAGILSMMFYINWRLTLFVLIPIPILIIATRIFQRTSRKSFIDVRSEVTALNTFVQEHITGMALVQLFNRQDSEYEKFRLINKRHRDAHIRGIMAYSVFFPVVEILSALSVVFLIYFGFDEVLEKRISINDLLAFIMYIAMLYRPIRQMADRFNSLQMGMVGGERVFAVLDTNEKIIQQENIIPESNHSTIKFTNVEFSYDEKTKVLNNVSFEINNATTTALVGATGSGKTSIISLLARLYEFQKGKITINNIDIRKIEKEWLTNRFVFVLQEVNLFADTVLNNITLFNSSITSEKVVECAKKIGVHSFIESLPDQYNHFLSERGNNLSSGQKQLIAILRAYVHNPLVLIFDEATSSVDSETEFIIQNAINELTKNRTCILIAHRLSTIKHAHQIIVLEKGEIIEQGSPQELLKTNGVYSKLIKTQFDL